MLAFHLRPCATLFVDITSIYDISGTNRGFPNTQLTYSVVSNSKMHFVSEIKPSFRNVFNASVA